jgi:hypothetical protein
LGIEAHREGDLKHTFNRTQRTLQLLRRLLDVISKSNNAWENFNSRNGDIGYFAADSLPDNVRHLAHRSLFGINQSFEILKGLQQNLHGLHKDNENSAQAVRLRQISMHSVLSTPNTLRDRPGPPTSLSGPSLWVDSPTLAGYSQPRTFRGLTH